MASRIFNRVQSAEQEVKLLYGKAVIGASGAVTNTTFGKYITSIAKTSTGVYTITLADVYPSLAGFSTTMLADTPSDFTFQLDDETVAVAATKTIVVNCLTAGSVAEPASGTILYFTIALKNSAL